MRAALRHAKCECPPPPLPVMVALLYPASHELKLPRRSDPSEHPRSALSPSCLGLGWAWQAGTFPKLCFASCGADPAIRGAFCKLTTTAMSANLRMQTCDVFDKQLLEVSAWWMGVLAALVHSTTLLPTLAIARLSTTSFPHCKVDRPTANWMLNDGWGA